MRVSDLPVLGLGLAADVAGALPNFRRFLPPGGVDTIDYFSFGAHFLQKRRIQAYIDDIVRSSLPIVFHPVNFNLTSDAAEDPDVLRGVREIVDYTRAVWMGQDVALWVYDDQYLGPFQIPSVLTSESAQIVARKIRALNAEFRCPFLIENPPVMVSCEDIHMLEFMRIVSEQADCGMVLDVGHLIGYQYATGRSLEEMPFSSFPFERVVEVHLAGLQFSVVDGQTTVIDQHAYPIHELCWEFIRSHARRMRSLRGITLEQEYCDDSVVAEHIRKARSLIRQLELF